MGTNILSGEESNTKIVAVFQNNQAAERCAQVLREKGVDPNQYEIIAPHETHYDRKLEPEEQGIQRTAVKAHVRLGSAGFVLGWLIWGGLYLAGVELISSTPGRSLIPILFFSTAAGLMWGGFVTMRPDQEVVIQEVETAVHEGHWSLVIHSRSSEQTHTITQTLSDLNIEIARSL